MGPRVGVEDQHGPAERARAGQAGDRPLVGLIRNPRSHRNKDRAPELADDPRVLTEAPGNHVFGALF